MYYTYNNRFKLLNVDSYFAELIDVNTSGDLTLNLTYNISQVQAIKHKTLRVDISVLAKSISMNTLKGFSTTGNNFNASQIVNSVRTQSTDVKNVALQQLEYEITKTSSDITAAINNQALSSILNGTSSTTIAFRKTKLAVVSVADVKKNNAIVPILVNSTMSNVSNDDAIKTTLLLDTKKLMNSLVANGVDPSGVVRLTDRTLSANEAKTGILKPSTTQEVTNSELTQLLYWYLYAAAKDKPTNTTQVQDNSLVHVLVNEPDDSVDVSTTVVLLKDVLTIDGADISHLVVKFDLIDAATGASVDTVTKSLDISKQIQLFYTPFVAPTLSLTNADSKYTLNITQVDPVATGVRIFKKDFSTVMMQDQPYGIIESVNLAPGKQMKLDVDTQDNSIALYRAVAIGALGTVGFDFTNIIVPPKKYVPVRTLSFNTCQTTNGVRLQVNDISPEVTSLEFLVRNLTLFEKDFRNVGREIHVISQTTKKGLTIVDGNVFSENVYEYAIRMQNKAGRVDILGNTLVEFVRPAPGQVDTSISNVTTTQSATLFDTEQYDVQFDITTNIVSTDADVVKELLQITNITQYENNVTAQRDLLNSLVAHNVQRVDVTTGTRCDFGVLTDTHFSDVALSAKNAIEQLRIGHTYRYEITPLLRATDTLFTNLQKTATDSITNKQYTFSPAKYLNPIVLNEGTIISSDGLKYRYAKSQMSLGVIGNVVTTTVTFDIDAVSFSNVSVTRLSDKLNIVSWIVQGNKAAIDHFVIMTNNIENRTLVGKVHSSFDNGYQFVHKITANDVGEISYIIVPVMTDYSIGTWAKTNSIIVELP